MRYVWRTLRLLHRATPHVPSTLRMGLFVVSILVILTNVATLVILFAFESEAAGFIQGGDPKQFYRELEVELLDDYKEVFGIAHNSGNTIRTTEQALAYGADIIEIDVALTRGQLHATHWSPLRFIGNRFFRGPTLAEVWGTAAQAEVIKLDLKRPSVKMVADLLSFLSERRKLANGMAREIVVVSDQPEVLALLSQDPSVIRMLSIEDSKVLRNLLRDADLMRVIDGVSVRHDLLTKASVQSLVERGLPVFAWIVNDPQRMNELVEYGVRGITTDNLAIMQLLGGQERGETTLRRNTQPLGLQ